MTTRSIDIVLVCLSLFLGSCTSKTERMLNEKLKNENYDFNNLTKGYDNIKYELKDNIQYGLIDLENGEQVKFWFLTHHASTDIGGTIYEYPDGEKQFCSGYHYCEVQFTENGKLGKRFQDVDDFRSYVTEHTGIEP